MTELILSHNSKDRDMTVIDETHALMVHLTDLLLDRHIDEILALDIDHLHTPETDNFRGTLRHIDLPLDRRF